ncbi:phosphoribosyltransferase [Aliarcobacter cibarius]|uniref:Phosphoribosyltransferase n=1 Tax=Aliarcobacter cibarius TaxID=255507 RepID=A0ABY2V410_9BACT|nr:phosphoribosyltransferase family protein [Aliarcobacter cibarius]TLS96216.1 phosphoribosyltransferase [Aliarcobacter cibarius]TLS96819.1 phosphoribosyltransferase [Aliarcobacter cibarius]
MEKLYYSYDMFKNDTMKLLQMCNNFDADVILAIARGGLTLSHLMSQALNKRNVFIINTISYDRKVQKDMVEIFNFPNLTGFKRVLVVDDIIDSGKTVKEVLNILKIHYPNIEFKVASLFYKDTAIIKPDYSVNKTDTWIEFFWEVDLDIKDNN